MAKKKTYGFRKFINDVHLWLGIGSGIVLFLVCFSGTFLAFEHEIKDLFTEKMVVTPTENVKSITELTSLVKNNVDGELSRVTLPSNAKEPYIFTIKTSPKDRRGTAFYVNPYTAEILKAPKSSADGFMMFMFRMHRWIMLDVPIGRPIVGIATIIFLILSVTGIVLWFPKKVKWKNMKSGFKIKMNANWKRVNHDLHNTLGFYACIFIVIMGLTGLCWSFEGYREGLGNLIGAKIFNRGGGPKLEAKASDGATISLEEAIAISQQEFDYEGDTRISFPNERSEFYNISKNNATSFSPVTSDVLTLDVYGNVLNKEYFNNKPLNVRIASLIKPLHTGEIFGMFSKIIYFLACLIATSLPITGTLIWINKMKKKKK
ncbi:putative iron-regulated membrane protein [Galbibacter orientalis DSM 19592]|uniref:Putative iron-regulated membrane protein n=1 Tax=Galbibacter orientalis DSM 19592 TaxID=926559 RepID=I3C4D7_9FLAO|nr:PepSY-associated TM helix domain-containing protein [Galbibacter orientalis]EIJ38480.1 putative iron-regulated membrane protein [Galbibacter orientalis DSM 19592]